MRKGFLFKTGGAILSALNVAVPWGINLMGLLPNWPWQLHALIAFLLFIIFVSLVIYDVYRENNRLRDAKPSVNVEPMEEGDAYYLKVHNNGGKGSFKAQIALTAIDPSVWQLQQYYGHWKYANKGETEILKGHDDFVKIAERVSSPLPGPISLHLRIIYYDESFKDANFVNTSSHCVGGKITSPNGNTRPMTKHQYELSVTISSQPSLREGIYQERYILNVDGLKIDPNSQSTVHKECSQT